MFNHFPDPLIRIHSAVVLHAVCGDYKQGFFRSVFLSCILMDIADVVNRPSNRIQQCCASPHIILFPRHRFDLLDINPIMALDQSLPLHTQQRLIKFVQRHVDLYDIVIALFNKILDDQVEFTAVAQRITCSAYPFPVFYILHLFFLFVNVVAICSNSVSEKNQKKCLTNKYSSYIITMLFCAAGNGGIAQLVEHSVHTRSVICSSQIAATRPVGQVVKTPPFHGGNMGSSPVRVTSKKASFVFQTKEAFLSDAFLRNEMRTSCVMQASPVMHAFGAWVERIASPITA